MKKIFEENGLLSGKRVLAATLVMVLLSSMTFFSAAAGHTWKSQGNVEAIKSDGSKTVVFDKSDLDYLDGRIDAIEADVSTGKENLANALNPLGTNPSLGTPLSGTSTFNELMEAINHSQAIPDKTIGESVSIATEDYELASKVTGQTINSDTKISAATADNLSLGTSAWVDGSLLIGTGADNKKYYNLGYTEGLAEINNSDIEYVYHHHTDDCLGTVTKTCTITKRFTTENHPAAWNSIWCGTCNANTYHDGMKITHSSCGQATDYQILNCSRHADNSNYYSTSTHTYTGTGYICGYNEGEIEKATIVIKK